MMTMTKYDSINVAPKMKELASDEIAWNLQRYESAKKATVRDRMRFLRNRRCAYSLDYDAWRDEDSGQMMEQGREPKTYNLNQKYVRGIAGNYIVNSYDPKFIDREDDSKDQQSTIYKYSRIRYADKEHLNYDASRNKCILDGVIGGGIEELVIVRTPDEPRGRVGFISGNYASWIIDPSVQSNRISRDAREAWKTHYMPAQEILDVWPWMSQEVKQKILMLKNGDKQNGASFTETTFITDELDKASLNDRYRVVEYLHFEYDKKTTVMYPGIDDPLPDTGFPIGSEDDFVALQIFASKKGIILDPSKIYVSEQRMPVLYCTVMCPDLGVVLDNRKDERQLNGHLPIYVWAYMMEAGKCIGVIDYTYYAADDFNKREAQKTKIMTQSMLYKPWVHGMLANDGMGQDKEKLVRLVSEMNDISKPLIVPENIPPQLTNSLMGIMSGAQLPQWLLQEETFKIQLMDQLANWNNALGGQSDRTNESGIHYGRKVMEGLINHTISTESLRQHEKDKAEDGLIMGIQLYGGRTPEEKVANYNRKFNGSDGEETAVNIYMGTDENGEDIVKNSISKLNRVDVVISQSKENDFQKSAKMETDSAMLRSMQPSEDNALAIAAVLADYLRSQPAEDDAQRKAFNEGADMTYELAKLKTQVMMKNLQNQLNPPAPPGTVPGAPEMPAQNGGAPAVGDMSPAPQPSLPPTSEPSPVAAGRIPLQNQSAVQEAPGRGPQ